MADLNKTVWMSLAVKIEENRKESKSRAVYSLLVS